MCSGLCLTHNCCLPLFLVWEMQPVELFKKTFQVFLILLSMQYHSLPGHAGSSPVINSYGHPKGEWAGEDWSGSAATTWLMNTAVALCCGGELVESFGDSSFCFFYPQTTCTMLHTRWEVRYLFSRTLPSLALRQDQPTSHNASQLNSSGFCLGEDRGTGHWGNKS